LHAKVTLSPCDPPGWEQNRAAGTKAIRYAISTGLPYALFVEDDIDLADDFPEAVNEAINRSGAIRKYHESSGLTE
jgi:hypothetical protein